MFDVKILPCVNKMNQYEKNNLRSIINMINNRSCDKIVLSYYPFVETSDNQQTQVKLKCLTETEVKKVLKKIKGQIKSHSIKSYVEYGYHNIFCHHLEQNKSYQYFKRDTEIFFVKDYEGAFLLEFITFCDEAEFPKIVNYLHHDTISLESNEILIDDLLINLNFIKSSITYCTISIDLLLDKSIDKSIKNQIEKFIRNVKNCL